MGSEGVVSAPKTFLIETIVGILIFLIIGSAAVALSYAVTFLDKNGVDQVIVFGLKCAEYMIFLVDLILLGRFLWLTFKRTWGKL